MSTTSFFLTALTILFIGLRIPNVITWSWWFVLMPAYVPLIFSFIVELLEKVKEKAIEKQREEYLKKHPERKSKFMTRLEEAMKASDERRKI